MQQVIALTKKQPYIFLYLFSFFLPLLPIISTITVILWAVVWIISGDWSQKWQRLKRPIPLLFISYFILHLIGMSYTNNWASGQFDLEVKLSFLALPLLLLTIPQLKGEAIRNTLTAFITGTTFACLYCLLQAGVVWKSTGNITELFYSKLGDHLHFHPTYFAIYVSISIFSIAVYLFQRWDKLSTLYRWSCTVLIVFLLCMIEILASRIVLLAFPFVGSIAFLLLMYQKKQVVKGVFITIMSLGLWFGLAMNLPTSGRMAQLEEVTESKKTNIRLKIWDASLFVISKAWLIGHGTGDVKDELLKAYAQKKYEDALILKFNAHNQYLQIGIALGVMGIVTLLLYLLLPFVLAIRSQSWLYALFLAIVMIVLLTESMLEVQRGTMMLAFFQCLFANVFLE